VNYLDFEKLENISRDDFWATRPYPYANKEGLLTPEGYQQLLENMPAMELFYLNVGKPRRAGQTPHDRYSLEYTADTPVPAPWREFIGELCSDRYRDNICRLFDVSKVEFRFHWHYTPTGCWVSPHTDSPREHGSHLFYFNSESDWDPSWGGDTLVLDDGGKLDFNTAPDLDAFDAEIPCQSIGNYSAIMKRTDHAWHAVRPITSPEGEFRKIFIVVVNPNSLLWKVRDRLIGKKKQAF
jgi:Rps23 Pro-64 3,4-dihydroxylase Tpa1-like proline 4-hydroxylase